MIKRCFLMAGLIILMTVAYYLGKLSERSSISSPSQQLSLPVKDDAFSTQRSNAGHKQYQCESANDTDSHREFKLDEISDSLRLIINILPNDQLAKQISQISFLSQEEILDKANPKDFIQRLLDITVHQHDDVKDSAEDSSYIPIRFSTELRSDNNPKQPRHVFSRSSNAIYGTFSLPMHHHETSIITRWYDLDSNKLLAMNRIAIDPYSENQYVWFKPNDGWKASKYSLSIFRDNDNLKLMGSGQFHIVR